MELACAARVFVVFDDLDDFGYDVAAAFNFDVVADEEAEAFDFVGVVQRGAGDRGASDGDRSEDGDGGELAGAANLDADVLDLSDAAAGGEFVSDRPARGASGVAEAALDGCGVDLDDDAIDFVTETVTSGLGFFDEGEDFFDGGDGFAVRIHAEADGGQGIEGSRLLGEQVFAGFGEEEVGVKVEPPLGDDVGLEGADGSGGADTDSNCTDFVTQAAATVSSAADAGATNIKVTSVAGFDAGQKIMIDTGANLETAVIATVGTAGATSVGAATDAGATVIPVVNATGFRDGQTFTIDRGTNSETAVVAAVRRGFGGTTITVAAPLTRAHSAGAQVSGTGITLAAALARAHAIGAQVTDNVPTPGAPNRYDRKPH